MTKAEAEATFSASCRREDALHQAYMLICASNTRVAALHYCCDDKALGWDPPLASRSSATSVLTNGISAKGGRTLNIQLNLLDAGCEYSNYASHITRSLPIGNGGRFATHAIYTGFDCRVGIFQDPFEHPCKIFVLIGRYGQLIQNWGR